MSSFFSNAGHYFSRVFTNEVTKRGLVAVGAGIIMSMILEVAWPSTRAV
jgi:hypothetical protein